MLPSLIQQVLKWVEKSPWRIVLRFLEDFMMELNKRGFKQSVVEDLAKYSGVPVWNGLTDIDHPTQILADLLTIEEHVSKPLNKVKVVFVGDTRNNMSYAWMYGCAKMGMNFVGHGPRNYGQKNKPWKDKSLLRTLRLVDGLGRVTRLGRHVASAVTLTGPEDACAVREFRARSPEERRRQTMRRRKTAATEPHAPLIPPQYRRHSSPATAPQTGTSS